MDFERLHKINKELLEKASMNLEKGYEHESFKVFSKCLKNHYYICWAKEHEEKEKGMEEVWNGGTPVQVAYYEEPKKKHHKSKMHNFKRETEMIKELEGKLEDEEMKEMLLEQLEETFKDMKILYPNFYETALRKVKKV